MTVASNADTYAAARVGIYFPGFPATLDGQCVSLIKWFLGEMCDVSDWKGARGDAKDYGDTLVRQGLATVVPASQRKRGDIVVWKKDGGGFGHIGVLLSGDRVFEENVGLIGTPSKMVGDFRVYVSRIDPLSASWRTGSPTFYRVKSYKENNQKGGDMADKVDLDTARRLADAILLDDTALSGKRDADLKKNHVGHDLDAGYIAGLFNSTERKLKLAEKAKQLADLKAKASKPAPAAPASDADKKLAVVKQAVQTIQETLGIK